LYDSRWVTQRFKAGLVLLGKERFVHAEADWALMHDPEGHNVLLLQKSQED